MWRAIQEPQILAVKQPVGLMRQDSKRPDGTTIIPWSRGKALAWDVPLPDTYAQSRLGRTAQEVGAAANQAATKITEKYSDLSRTHVFYPVAVETAGTWHQQTMN